jgi:hypothetical protein
MAEDLEPVNIQDSNNEMKVPNHEQSVTPVVDLWSPDLLELYSMEVDHYRNIFDYRINPYLRMYNDWLPGFSSADIIGDPYIIEPSDQQMQST